MSPEGYSSTPHSDDDLKQLFREEADTRLSQLATGLLALEEHAGESEFIDAVFRDAHTLKGSAAVVGLDDIRHLAHGMEDVLHRVRSGGLIATPSVIDALLAATDKLSALVPGAIDGLDQSGAAEEALTALKSSVPSDRDSPDAPSGAAPKDHDSTTTEVERASVPLVKLDHIVRLVGESVAAELRLGKYLREQFNADPMSIAEFRDLSIALNDLQERTMNARMVGIGEITDQLHRGIRDVARSLGRNVHWEVRGNDTELDRGVLQALGDSLLQVVRNAVAHGIEPPEDRIAAGKPEMGTVRLHAMQLGSEVVLSISDDGRGIELAKVREVASRTYGDIDERTDEELMYVIFRSGISTSEYISDISGRGVGLDIVRSGIESVRGRIEVHSEPGVGTEFRLVVPITLAVLRCLMVESHGRTYAIPLHAVMTVLDGPSARRVQADGESRVWVAEETLRVASLHRTLWNGKDHAGPSERQDSDSSETGSIVIVAGTTRSIAFTVDALLGQRDVVVKGLGNLLPPVQVVTGGSVEPDGSILLVLDPPGLVARARRRKVSLAGQRAVPVVGTPMRRGTILVVDDAMAVRELQRSILERAGYTVHLAGDGFEALRVLATGGIDFVLTDVEMPNMDGFVLTEAIRSDASLVGLPVVILTSRTSDEDRQRAMEIGANGYIVKSAFDQRALLEIVDRLLLPQR